MREKKRKKQENNNYPLQKKPNTIVNYCLTIVYYISIVFGIVPQFFHSIIVFSIVPQFFSPQYHSSTAIYLFKTFNFFGVYYLRVFYYNENVLVFGNIQFFPHVNRSPIVLDIVTQFFSPKYRSFLHSTIVFFPSYHSFSIVKVPQYHSLRYSKLQKTIVNYGLLYFFFVRVSSLNYRCISLIAYCESIVFKK